MSLFKRATSLVMGLVLMLSMVPSVSFAADDLPDGEYVDGAASLGSSVSVSESDSSSSFEQNAGDQSSGGVLPVATREASDEASLQGEMKVSFVFVDEPVVVLGGTQNVVVGLDDEGARVSAASLSYRKAGAAQTVAVQASNVIGSTMLFSRMFSSAEDVGEYEFVDLSYVLEGSDEEHVVSMLQSSESGTAFSVIEPLALLSDDDSEAGSMSIYSLDDSGALSEADSISVDADEPAASVSVDAASSAERSSAARFVIALDPGHGGSDPGAGAYGLREKDLNWKIAQACKSKLESLGYFDVVLTRSENECPGLTERVHRAVNAGARAFVSIHINSGGGTGSEVWIPNKASYLYNETHAVSEDLANDILSKITALGLVNRGVKWRDNTVGDTYPDGSLSDYYTVINEARNCGIPGIIVEHAFVDNANDAGKLASDAFLRSLGQADAEGIAKKFSFGVGGVNVSASSVSVGQKVTFSADVSGNTSGLRYNYVWRQGSGWSNWGSTVKDKGSMTKDSSGSFIPKKAGTYEVWVDVANAGGYTITTEAFKIRVVDSAWSASGTSAPSKATVGQEVRFSAKVSGDASGLRYNYVWQRGDGWSDWGSTTKGGGKPTSAASGSFTPKSPGTYHVWVDVVGPDGYTVTTSEARVAVSGYTIMGSSSMTPERLSAGYRSAVGDIYPSGTYLGKGASTIDEFSRIVCEEARAEGVKPEVLFAQAMYETGWLRFGGSVKAEQCNFGGLGAVNASASGATFENVRIGLRAQVQHLKAYASTEPLRGECVDPRFGLVARGSAPYVEQLSGKWAVPGIGYGSGIVSVIGRL